MRPRSVPFIRNAVSAYAPFLVDLFLKMAIIRIILQLHGTELVGLWGLLKSILALPLFLQEGVCFAIFLDSSEKSESTALQDVLTFSAVTGMLIAALMLFLSPVLTDLFSIPSSFRNQTINAFRIAAVFFAISAPAQAVLYSIRGVGRFDLAAALLIGISVLNFVLVAFFLWNGEGIVGLITADLICGLILLLGSIWIHLRLVGSGSAEKRPIFAISSLTRMWNLTKRTAAQLFYSATARAFWEIDALLISRFFGIQTMGSYWIGRRIPYVYGDFLWAGIWPAVPATQQEQNTEETLERIHWLQSAILIPWAIFLFITSPHLLLLWTGISDPTAVTSMRYLIFAVAFDFVPATAISYFFGKRKVLLVATILFVALILKSALAIYACFTQEYLLLLLSTVLSALVFAVAILFLFARNTSASVFKMLRPLLAFFVASAFAVKLSSLLPVRNDLWMFVFHAIVFGILAYGASFFLLRLFYPQGFSAFVRFAAGKSSLFHVLYSKPYAFLRRASLSHEMFRENREQRFEKLYQNHEDPWDYQTSEYERSKYREMEEFLSGRKFIQSIEVGCSEGIFTKVLADLSHQVIALDISSTAIERASKRCKDHKNIEFRRFDVVTDPFPEGSDLICCGEILNCLASKKQFLTVRNKIVEALSVGGWLLLVNLHLFPDDRKGLVLKDMGFGSTDIRDQFSGCRELKVLRDEDHEEYRITLFEKIS